MSVRANYTKDLVVSDGNWVDPRAFGSTLDKTTLDAAIADIGSDNRTLVIPPGTWVVGTNLAIPANVELDILEGGLLSPSAGITITINGFCKSKLYQVFTGDGDITFTTSSAKEVYPEMWGTGVGTIQKAVDAVSGTFVPVKLTARTYQFATKLVIDEDYMVIEGPTYPYAAGVTSYGAILEFTGTSGEGIEIGISPDGSGTYINGLILQNFSLHVTSNTDKAMRIWHPLGCTFKNISVRGNSDNDGSTNTGIEVCASQATNFKNISVDGKPTGETALQYGIDITLGHSNAPCTTTYYENIYVRNCDIGMYLRSRGEFNNLIIEACDAYAILCSGNGRVENSHFESLPFVALMSGAGQLFLNRCVFNITNAEFFQGATHTGRMEIRNCTFAGAATPEIFKSANSFAGQYRIGFCTFEASTSIKGAAAKIGWDKAIIEDMNIVTYQFVQTNVAQNTTYDPIETLTAHADKDYVMPIAGNILGVNSYYSDTIGTGSYTITVQKNGGDLANLTLATINADNVYNDDFLKNVFAAGDTLSVKVATTNPFATETGDLVVEVIVALGDDGL
jgi:hypothetical protein